MSKILSFGKELKAFGDKIKTTQMTITGFDRAENVFEMEEMLGTITSLFPTMFSKGCLTRVVKTLNIVVPI